MTKRNKELDDFILVNRGLKKIGTSPRPENGNLLIDGNIVHYNQPFALLQYKKKELIKSGILSRRIKITYV